MAAHDSGGGPPTVSSAGLDSVREALRPHPHRGDVIAAGAIPLAAGVVMMNVRMDDRWGAGIHLVLTALVLALVLGMALLASLEEGRPRAYHTVLLVTGLVLAAVVLYRLAQVLGSDRPLAAAGARTWMALVLAAVSAWVGWSRNSPVCALIAALAGGVALLAFVDWVFDPQSTSTFRWILLVLIAAYALAAVWRRDREPRHSVQMVNAAGVATIGLILSFVGGLLFLPAVLAGGFHGPGVGWEILELAAAFGLLAYAAVDREPGPGYLGFVALLLFVFVSGRPGDDGATILGWPLLLVLAGGVALGFGLRPRRALPPSPGPDEPAETYPLRPDPDPEPARTEPTRPMPPDQAT